jgi:hypothetical protein
VALAEPENRQAMNRRTITMPRPNGYYGPHASITIEQHPDGRWAWATEYRVRWSGSSGGLGLRFAEPEDAAILAGINKLKQDCERLAEGLDHRSSTDVRAIQRWLRDTENSLQQPTLFDLVGA